MAFEIVGKLIEKYPVAQITDTFKKREFVVEKVEQVNGKNFPNYIKFQLLQDKTSLIDNFSLQQEIKVFFNVRGSKWNKNGVDNYITNLDAWKIEIIQTPQTPQNQNHQNNNYTNSNVSNETLDDLPF